MCPVINQSLKQHELQGDLERNAPSTSATSTFLPKVAINNGVSPLVTEALTFAPTSMSFCEVMPSIIQTIDR